MGLVLRRVKRRRKLKRRPEVLVVTAAAAVLKAEKARDRVKGKVKEGKAKVRVTVAATVLPVAEPVVAAVDMVVELGAVAVRTPRRQTSPMAVTMTSLHGSCVRQR